MRYKIEYRMAKYADIRQKHAIFVDDFNQT